MCRPSDYSDKHSLAADYAVHKDVSNVGQDDEVDLDGRTVQHGEQEAHQHQQHVSAVRKPELEVGLHLHWGLWDHRRQQTPRFQIWPHFEFSISAVNI